MPERRRSQNKAGPVLIRDCTDPPAHCSQVTARLVLSHCEQECTCCRYRFLIFAGSPFSHRPIVTMAATRLALTALVAMLPLASAFQAPPSLLPAAISNLACSARVERPALRAARMQLEAPEKITIPDSFNPAEWAKRGGGGLGGGGGFQVPDSFNPADMEREKERTNVAVMDRPSDKLDPGKKYRVLLFNDENNTREYVIEVLMKYIPGMSAEMAKEITARAHNTGMAIVGVWMYELAEGYSDILRSNGLKSDIEAD